MMHLSRHQRQLSREARLCYMASPDVPKETVLDTAGKYGAESLQWLTKNVTWLAGETLQQASRLIIAIPKGVQSGLKQAWEALPSADQTKERFMLFLNKTAEFIQSAPVIRNVFETTPEIKNFKTLENLTDHAQWIVLFRAGSDILTQPFDPANALPPEGEEFGPRELLLSLPPEQRQKIYLEYVDRYIPQNVQKETGIHAIGKNATERFAAMSPAMRTVNGALGGILGFPEWDTGLVPAESKNAGIIAKKSLASYYRLDDDAFNDDLIDHKLTEDYRAALSLTPNAAIPEVATNPAELAKNLPASRIAGALKMGVVYEKQLEQMFQVEKDKEHEHRLTTGRVHNKLEKLSGAQNERMKQDVMSLRDSWDSLGGLEKLILAGAVVYTLTKSKFARGASIAVVGAYFFQKMVMKEKDPVKKWSELIKGPTGFLKDKNAAVFGGDVTPGFVDKAYDKINPALRFLNDFDVANLDTQATGMVLLSEMPMSLLASNYHMDGVMGEQMFLNVTRGSPIDTKMEESMKLHGWNTNYKQYFQSEESAHQVSDAMSYAFFTRAAKANSYNMERAKKIFEERGRLMPGSSMLSFARAAGDFDSEISDPALRDRVYETNQEYIRLVAEGRDLCMNSGDKMTLGEFMSVNADMIAMGTSFESKSMVERGAKSTGSFTPPSIPTVGSAPGSSPSLGSTPPSTPALGSSPRTSPSTGSSPGSSPSIGSTPSSSPSTGSSPGSSPSLGSMPSPVPRAGSAPSTSPSIGSSPGSSPSPGSTPRSAPSSGSASPSPSSRTGASPSSSPRTGGSTPPTAPPSGSSSL